VGAAVAALGRRRDVAVRPRHVVVLASTTTEPIAALATKPTASVTERTIDAPRTARID
jgi:hypothetical protein